MASLNYEITMPSFEIIRKNIVSSSYKVDRIIYNNPATIVIWSDGTKTVSKCADGEVFNEEVGFFACLAKKIYGNRNQYLKSIKKAYRQENKE